VSTAQKVAGSASRDETRPVLTGILVLVMVELERREPPIGGTVRIESEPDRPFVGWIGLLGALEAALGTNAQDVEGPASTDPGG
jgi:hypothetical protein